MDLLMFTFMKRLVNLSTCVCDVVTTTSLIQSIGPITVKKKESRPHAMLKRGK